jgi:hypothetical protein
LLIVIFPVLVFRFGFVVLLVVGDALVVVLVEIIITMTAVTMNVTT